MPADSTARELDIPRAIAEMDYQLERLENVAKQLWDRVTPVLRIEPQNSSTADQPVEGACALGQAINSRRQRLATIADSLEQMHYLIEL